MPESTTNKRKSTTAGSSRATKKARAHDEHADAWALVSDILADSNAYPIPEDKEEVRQILSELAEYARALEQQSSASGTGAEAAPAKSKEQLEDATEKIRKAASAGIKKQMSRKPSCKTESAKWSYDGICPDPNVFATLLGLNGPPTWKMKKLTLEEFEKVVGRIRAHARYNDLRITGTHVNARWSDSGEFKFSGTYGI